MYKMALLDDLYQDYKDAAEKHQEFRNHDAEQAMVYLCRMKEIGKRIKYTQQMIDGTMGKIPEAAERGHGAVAAGAAGAVVK